MRSKLAQMSGLGEYSARGLSRIIGYALPPNYKGAKIFFENWIRAAGGSTWTGGKYAKRKGESRYDG